MLASNLLLIVDMDVCVCLTLVLFRLRLTDPSARYPLSHSFLSLYLIHFGRGDAAICCFSIVSFLSQLLFPIRWMSRGPIHFHRLINGGWQ